MRILVTGARGKVGAATLDRLLRAGHEVTAVDWLPPVYERAGPVRYVQADLTDAGHAAAVVPGHDGVVHTAAIPSPAKNPPHEIFQTNLMATYQTLEAAERSGVGRFVHLSSETVPGFSYPRRYFHARSGRPGSSGRATSSGTSARSCVRRGPTAAPRSGPTSSSTTWPSCWPAPSPVR
jgi:UDP-glucose 4-epimerase